MTMPALPPESAPARAPVQERRGRSAGAAWRNRIQDHQPFLFLLLLFAAFRLLTLFLFRPGGFIADFSDYDFYYEWGVLTPMGYVAYDNLWTAYPPLFPALMLSIFEWSSRIPPWVEPRLFFHLLFGSAMMLFECGNFVCIYWLGRRLAHDEPNSLPSTLRQQNDHLPSQFPAGLWPAILYGFLFMPVYTMAGWFEPMPLFFMLSGLCLLLISPAGWILAAVAAGLGFLTKLTPILLLPIGVRWLGARLSWSAVRNEWFQPRSSANLLRPLLFILIFAAVVIGIGYPLVNYDLTLAFSSFRVQEIRPPWQSIWALIDGYYGWGLVPLSMRNLEGLFGPLWQSAIPWTWVSLAFVALYAYLYTRPYDWTRIRTPLVFAALSVTILFLYSKGWSPQFLVWILVFIVLLAPSPRWLCAAVLLSLLNLVESTIYFIILPGETWLLFGTVIIRTILLVLFCGELLLQIWPSSRPSVLPFAAPQRLYRGLSAAVWLIILTTVVLGVTAFPRAATAYQASRLAEHSCRDTVLFLQNAAIQPTNILVTQQPDIWRDFYPWLRHDYTLFIIDGYDTQDRYVETALARLAAQLETQPGTTEFWWLARTDINFPGSSPPQVWETYQALPDVYIVEELLDEPCVLARVVNLTAHTSAGEAETPGATIQLRGHTWQTDESGGLLHLVLYWQADAPVSESYTVFVHLLDEHGNLVGQQDNLPVMGLAPTNHWTPGALIRDPYAIPYEGNPPRVIYVGLYTEAGRLPIQQATGPTQDQIEIHLQP